jgi:hypothetical protein
MCDPYMFQGRIGDLLVNNEYPIIGICSDDVHVTTNKGEDLSGNTSRIFNNEVTSTGKIGNMVED